MMGHSLHFCYPFVHTCITNGQESQITSTEQNCLHGNCIKREQEKKRELMRISVSGINQKQRKTHHNHVMQRTILA